MVEDLTLFQARAQMFLKQFLNRKIGAHFGAHFSPISLRTRLRCVTLAEFQLFAFFFWTLRALLF